MNKRKARAISNNLEDRINAILRNWKQVPIEEDDYSITLAWKYLQCEIIVFIFWGDAEEGVRLDLIMPRGRHEREWRQLSGGMIDEMIDTLASFATVAINQKRK